MNYLFNDRNLIRGAVLSALNVVGSDMIYRTDDDAKVGSGVVSLTGPYTGAHDSTIDVEILDGSGDSSQVSQPVFTGVGNGEMTGVSVTGLDAQQFTVTLIDLGTTTRAAQAPFQGATLEAIDVGAAGNLITIAVSPDAIVRTPINATLQEPLRAGTNAYVGSQWDFAFGANNALTPDGSIPDTAPRLSFGDDPQVYRAFKSYDYAAQQWVYAFSPPPVRDVQAGELVKAVTGTWAMTITDGTTTENYPTIVTLYDALSAINTSTLIHSLTPPTNDRHPNGQAVTDLSVWTQSFVLSITADGSRAVQQADIAMEVLEAAPTEALSIRCTSNAVVGAEVWAVQGPISGQLENATTGVAYADGPYLFTIPVQLPPPEAPGGDISVLFSPVGRDADSDSAPILCVDRALLGANAQNGSFRFVWTKKPTPCPCTDEISDLVNFECLGLEAEGGGPVAANAVSLRKQRLVTAVRGFIEANTTPPESVDSGDVDLINTSADILAAALAQLDGDGATLSYPAWQASHVYAEGATIMGSGGAIEFRFMNVQPGGGTSAASVPTFPTTVNDVVTDGTAVWVNLGKLPLIAFDDAFDDWKDDMALVSGQENPQNYPVWKPGQAYNVVFDAPEESSRVVPTQQNGFYYEAGGGSSAVKTTGNVEPIWPTTADDTVHEFLGDGSDFILWTAKAFADATVQRGVTDEFYERYRSQMNDVLFAAGIDANFNSASTAGSPCWRDFDDNDHWFESVDGYKPMQLHHAYYSVKDGTDEEGRPIIVPTFEFAVFLEWGCAERLQDGDVVTINIGNVSGGVKTYQPDDEITVSVAHADPVPFGGGQTGNDTKTWSVTGSEDGSFPPYYQLENTPPTRANTHPYAVGDRYIPATPNGHWYQVTVAGTSAGSPPTFTTDRTTFADGGATVQDMGTFFGYSFGGLSFTITDRGIDFALLDTFRFSSVGGHFRWRQNGGSWSSSTVIGTTVLVDGLSAVFTGGAQDPSWATGDVFSFAAISVNGADQVMSPADGRLTWTGSTTISITPTAGPASRFAVFDHHIPSNAVITLQGSDDNFATTPTSIVIPWTERNLLAVFAAVTRAKWRLVVDKGGDIFWMFLGEQMQPAQPTSEIADLGLFKKRRRLPGIGVRSGLGGDIQHEVTSQSSFEDFMAGIDYACINDDRSFGIVVNESISEVSLVRLPGTVQEAEDLFDYQPGEPEPNRYQSFSLTVEPRP